MAFAIGSSAQASYVFVTKWGFYGDGDGRFKRPIGVAVDAAGNAYVADSWNHRIQKFAGDGTFVTKWHGFSYPEGLAVDGDGRVYVADSGNNRIAVFAKQPTYEIYLPATMKNLGAG